MLVTVFSHALEPSSVSSLQKLPPGKTHFTRSASPPWKQRVHLLPQFLILSLSVFLGPGRSSLTTASGFGHSQGHSTALLPPRLPLRSPTCTFVSWSPASYKDSQMEWIFFEPPNSEGSTYILEGMRLSFHDRT